MELDFSGGYMEVYWGQRQVDAVYLGTEKVWPIAVGPKVWTFNPDTSVSRPAQVTGPVNVVKTGDIIKFTLTNNYDGVAVGVVRLGSNLHGETGGSISSILQIVKGAQPKQVNVSPAYGPYVPWMVFTGPDTWELKVIGSWSHELIFAYMWDFSIPEFDQATQIPFAARHA